MPTEPDTEANAGNLLTGQCWEDGDVLLSALAVQSVETVVTTAGAGDNALALLLADPGRVIAVDPDPTQIACCQLKSAAFRRLGYGELLEWTGSRASIRRPDLLREVLRDMPESEQGVWQSVRHFQEGGIGGAGKLEHQMAAFRKYRLPLAAGKAKIDWLFQPKSESERAAFHDQVWNSVRWRSVYRSGFSRIHSSLFEDTAGQSKPASGSLDGILARFRQQAVTLDPLENPYLSWLLRGQHGDVLPPALKARNHQTIRDRIDRIEWRCQSVEGALGALAPQSVDRFNLGSLFESTSDAAYQHLLKVILRAARPGARLVYWNTLVVRSRPDSLKDRIRPLTDVADRLNAQDRSLFGQRLVVEEICG